MHIVRGKWLPQNVDILLLKSTIYRLNGLSKHTVLEQKKLSRHRDRKLAERIIKNSDVHESPISHDTLIITDAESGVKQRVPKVLLECSMRQLQN